MNSVIRARRTAALLIAAVALLLTGSLVTATQSRADAVGTTITGINCAQAVAPAKTCFAELGPVRKKVSSTPGSYRAN